MARPRRRGAQCGLRIASTLNPVRPGFQANNPTPFGLSLSKPLPSLQQSTRNATKARYQRVSRPASLSFRPNKTEPSPVQNEVARPPGKHAHQPYHRRNRGRNTLGSIASTGTSLAANSTACSTTGGLAPGVKVTTAVPGSSSTNRSSINAGLNSSAFTRTSVPSCVIPNNVRAKAVGSLMQPWLAG